jgi:dTDP-4-amino-4,6-dideoxygalactose transaminase
MSKLALGGGTKVREKPFPAYRVIGEDEKQAALEVLESGVLSRYLGCWDPDFYGGSKVQQLEQEWAAHFGAKHAIAVNSCTSGLYCAVGATGVGPGDEIIVSPYSMSVSATAPLIYNAIPVFADIEPDCFCVDPASIESKITSRTKAIIAVDIFGQPYDADAINRLAKKHDLIVIEDCAQAPGALHAGRAAGTLGDMGVYSLNYHKHIHCGEGGMIVTDDDELAERMRLIRNHAEAVVGDKGTRNLVNMIGFNFRLPEIESAIAACQLKRLDGLVSERQENCQYLNERLSEIPAITAAPVRDECTHVYYLHAFLFDEAVAGVGRDRFIDAVRAELPVTTLREAEGVLLGCGYVKPLYLQPLYQQQVAYGNDGYPFRGPHYDGEVDYRPGLCPVAERMHAKELFAHEMMRPGMTRDDLDDVVAAFTKVWEHREELRTENRHNHVSSC